MGPYACGTLRRVSENLLGIHPWHSAHSAATDNNTSDPLRHDRKRLPSLDASTDSRTVMINESEKVTVYFLRCSMPVSMKVNRNGRRQQVYLSLRLYLYSSLALIPCSAHSATATVAATHQWTCATALTTRTNLMSDFYIDDLFSYKKRVSRHVTKQHIKRGVIRRKHRVSLLIHRNDEKHCVCRRLVNGPTFRPSHCHWLSSSR